MIQHIEIINKQNRVLRGYLDHPEGANRCVVMLHGYTGNKTEHNGYFRTMSRLLNEQGIASLRMDYSCNGESDGEFYEFSYLEAIEDAKLMLQTAKNFPGIETISLMGFSMGGAIAALVCNEIAIDRLLLWSPAGTMYQKMKERFDAAPKMENGHVYSAGFELSGELIDSMADIDPFRECESFEKPVLVIHGRQDKAVPYLTGVTYTVKFPNSRLHIVNESGHGYDEEPSKTQLLEQSMAFLKQLF
ncbi:MAG: alpha/beta fold hydrolase [Bacilli bacterium]|nr:alpha/beta fold hydrolase [Bacilli bacterium]